MNPDPKIDLVFKKLFAAEENKDILMSLINSVLPKNEQIVNLELKNPYELGDYLTGKNIVLDIKATDENGIFFDIEMQIKHYDFYPKRTLFYWARMFSTQLDKSPNKAKHTIYTELKKCIVISFMDFVYFKDDEKYFRCITLKDRENSEMHEALDYLELYFIELPKFKGDVSIMSNIRTIQDEWLTFLKKGYDDEGLPQYLDISDPLVKKAREQLKIMGFNDLEQEYYEAQKKAILDHNSGLEETERKRREINEKEQEINEKEQEIAIEKQQILIEKQQIELKNQAIEKEKAQFEIEKAQFEANKAQFETENLAIVKKLLENGAANEFISLVTQISEEEIEKLRKKLQ